MKAIRLRPVVRGLRQFGLERRTMKKFARRSTVGRMLEQGRQCTATNASNSVADVLDMNAELGYATIVEELEERFYRREFQSGR